MKETWIQYINDNNMLFRSSLSEKVRKKLQLGRSCFDVVNESRIRYRNMQMTQSATVSMGDRKNTQRLLQDYYKTQDGLRTARVQSA